MSLPRALSAQLFALFAAGYFLSYAFRAIGPLIAPDLMRELQLNAGQLGLLAGVYFLAFAIAQPFIGIAMDRHGPLKVNAVLLAIAAAGSAVFAGSEHVVMLALGRALIGLGVSGALMTAMKAFVVWYPLRHRETLSSAMMAVGGIAAMVVSVPAELAMREIGWRGVFWSLSGASLLAAGALWWRFSAASAPASGSQSHSSGSVLQEGGAGAHAASEQATQQGFRTIFTSRIFIAYAPLAFFASGGFSAVQSLWAGPWLIEVGGHSRAAAAQVLFAYGFALLAGYLGAGLISGSLQARPGAPRAFYIGGLALAFAALAAIVSNAWPGSSWPWFAYGLTLGTSMLAYPALTRVFPAAIAGRVVTAYNVVMFVGAFVLQWGIGALIQVLLNHGVATVRAYQTSFGAMLAAQVLSLLWFGVMSRRRT